LAFRQGPLSSALFFRKGAHGMGFTVTYDPNGAAGGTVPIDPTQY
jgi:hypothetical protein